MIISVSNFGYINKVLILLIVAPLAFFIARITSKICVWRRTVHPSPNIGFTASYFICRYFNPGQS